MAKGDKSIMSLKMLFLINACGFLMTSSPLAEGLVQQHVPPSMSVNNDSAPPTVPAPGPQIVHSGATGPLGEKQLPSLCIRKCRWTPECPRLLESPYREMRESEIVCHNNIMTLFDKRLGFPFATYAIHSQNEMTRLAGGRKEFTIDPLVNVHDQHFPNDTIFHTPYSRGHLTPSYIMSYDKRANGPWQESYMMTNILPQIAVFNEGAWERFEMNIVQGLVHEPEGTIWEIYTGGFWNGNQKLHENESIPQYVFWKAFCDRKICSSGLIVAKGYDSGIAWEVMPVIKMFPGLFDQCCPWNKALDKWKHLLNDVDDILFPVF